MSLLHQASAYNRTFFMVDANDHVTGLASLTVTVTLSKNGGAFNPAAGAVSEIGSGWYYIALTTEDTGTAGDLALHCTATGADPTDFMDQVIVANLAAAIPTAADVRTEMDNNSTKLAAIPSAEAIRSEMDTNSSKLANLDAAVSTRSTYAGGAVESVTSPVTVDDKTGFELSETEHTAITALIVAALNFRAAAEPSPGAPPAAPTLEQALMYLYAAWRNQLTTSNTVTTIRNSSGTAIAKASLSDNGSTFTKGAFGAP